MCKDGGLQGKGHEMMSHNGQHLLDGAIVEKIMH